MPPPPDPRALFSLRPLNGMARAAVRHPNNEHLQSILSDNEVALSIGHVRSKSCNNNTIATLGRGPESDVFIEGSSISRTQCSFEVDVRTNIVMFFDRSHEGTSQVSGPNAKPFENGRTRKVVVQKKLNTIIGIGGKDRRLVQFGLEWHINPTEEVQSREGILSPQRENPRLARTLDDIPTAGPSTRMTRIHTPGIRPLKMRYVKVGKLGSGMFGTVYKAIDVDMGRWMAVKILRQPEEAAKQVEWEQSVYYALKREVEILSQISHPHIVDYIASQGWDGPEVEIFMGLKHGTLESLIESGNGLKVANFVLQHILQALDCLAWNGIVHRDVKPENILYLLQPDATFQFQLGDFGLCSRTITAQTNCGSPIFIAPEIYARREQTSKADVWSLYVSLYVTVDVHFRQMLEGFKSYEDVKKAVLSSTSDSKAMSGIREMVVLDPEKRASAAQMLVKCYQGAGLSTPLSQVPALNTTNSDKGAPVSASPPHESQRNLKGLRRSARKTAGASRGVNRSQPLTTRNLRAPKVLPVISKPIERYFT